MSFYAKCGCGNCDSEIYIGEDRKMAEETILLYKIAIAAGLVDTTFMEIDGKNTKDTFDLILVER